MGGKADFMKIRQYVIDTIAVGGNQPVNFPPTRELGKMFDVSQPTALRAIKDLISEGFLSPCRGGGTISCPGNLSPNTQLKIFGILTNTGQQAFDVYYYLKLAAAVSLELTRRSEEYCTQQLFLESASLLEKTVQEKSLAGLILLDVKGQVPDYAEKAKKKGLPVVSIIDRFNSISSLYDPVEDRFFEILNKLFAENRTHVLITCKKKTELADAIRRAVARACKANHVPDGQIILVDRDGRECKEKVSEMLEFGMKFDAVVFFQCLRSVYDLIRDRLETVNTCRFVCDESSVYDNLKYTGYAVNYHLEDAAKPLIDNLLLQLNSPDAPVIHEKINYSIKLYKEGVLCE